MTIYKIALKYSKLILNTKEVVIMTKLGLIARGKAVKIFSYKEQRILKLFRKKVSDATVEFEVSLTSYVQDMINEVENTIDITEVNGRKGIVFEKVAGSHHAT